MSEPVDVCIVEDDPCQRALMVRALKSAGHTTIDVESAELAFQIVKSDPPKVVLSDYLLPGLTGLDLCRQMREDPSAAKTYFILVTAHNNKELKLRAWESEIDDYLPKPLDLGELLARVRVGMRIWAMQEGLRAAAITDGLTGLYNHDHFTRALDQEMHRARRYGRPIAFIMLDIDHFKAVNDTFGHLVGNEALVALSKILRETARENDILARFGGEEFAIILPEALSSDATVVAERIRHAVRDNLQVDGLANHPISVSCGVADTEDPRVHSTADLIDLADRAMYAAKRAGRDRVVCACKVSEEVLSEEVQSEETPSINELDILRKKMITLRARLKDTQLQSITCLGQALEEKDPFTARHSANVAYYAEQIARQLGCAEAAVKAIRNAGLLHDVGKVGIPDRILLKRGRLDSLEEMVIAQVPHISTRIVDCLRILEPELEIIRHQREYYDGTGYPNGLEGEQIPIGARVLLVADAFDAMTTDRVYRSRRSIDDALEELKRGSGTQFDARAVVAVRQILDRDRAAWQTRIDESADLFQLPSCTG